MTATRARPASVHRSPAPHRLRSDGRIVLAIAARGLGRMKALPILVLPVLVMPVFFVISFSGSFSGLTDVDGYGTDQVINWMAPYAAIQGAVFAGLTSSFIAANDIESGFFDRLLLAPGSRLPVLFGTLLYGAVRGAIPAAAVLTVASIGGLAFPGGVLAVVMLLAACVATALFFSALGLTIAYLMRTLRSMMFVQVIGFASMFLSIGQVPLSFQTGWLHAVSRVNPMTNILRMARQGFIGDVTWGLTWPALVASGLLLGTFTTTAVMALRRFDR